MRRYVLPFVLIVGLLAGGFYFLLNKTWALTYLIPKLAPLYLQGTGVELKSFTFTRQSYQAPATLVLEDVALTFARDGREYPMQMKRLTLEDVLSLKRSREQLRAGVWDLQMTGGWGRAEAMNGKWIFSFAPQTLPRVDAIIMCPVLELKRYHFENVYARLKGDIKQMQVFEITSSAYGGNVFGQISFDLRSDPTAVVWLEFTHLEPRDLQKIESRLMPQLAGYLDGSFRLIIHPGRVELMDINMNMPQGGVVKPDLMIKLIDKITDIEKKDRLEALMSDQDQFKADEAAFSVRNVSDQKLTIFVTMRDKKNNLHIKETLEYSLDEGLNALLLKKE